ncbi:hypothetical protein NVP1181O_01, partial [Vibrio phage 1.181.O._10N.286.46.C9]
MIIHECKLGYIARLCSNFTAQVGSMVYSNWKSQILREEGALG